MASTLVPFETARLKVARARKHMAELESEISEYIKRDPHVAIMVRNSDSGDLHIAVRSREAPPPHLAVVFGDFLYCLRSALDFLANDLVSLSGAIPKNVYFPFAESAEALEDQIKGKMRGAAPDFSEVVRSFQPYRGGNEHLRALHDLNIRDKHVTLLTASSMNSFTSGMESMVEIAPGHYASDFRKIATIPIDPAGFKVDADEEVVGKVATSKSNVTIGAGLPLAGKPVSKVMHDLLSLVEGIIETFEAHCLRR